MLFEFDLVFFPYWTEQEIISKWASSYARAVELRPGAEKTGALEFVALFSKPSKEESIAWPVVRVHFSVADDFETSLTPKITYRLEDERMVFHVNTDFVSFLLMYLFASCMYLRFCVGLNEWP